MKKLPKINTSKLLKAALPYILVGLMATKLGQAYGADNPASKSQGVKQLMAGGGIMLLGLKVVPLLSSLITV